jgi:hypothetical protein
MVPWEGQNFHPKTSGFKVFFQLSGLVWAPYCRDLPFLGCNKYEKILRQFAKKVREKYYP